MRRCKKPESLSSEQYMPVPKAWAGRLYEVCLRKMDCLKPIPVGWKEGSYAYV